MGDSEYFFDIQNFSDDIFNLDADKFIGDAFDLPEYTSFSDSTFTPSPVTSPSKFDVGDFDLVNNMEQSSFDESGIFSSINGPKSEETTLMEDNCLLGKKRGLEQLYDSPSEKSNKKPNIAEIDQVLIKSRSLSLEEEKKLKKERRLIKNRESAQQSRQRKKAYVENLEKEVKKLKDENIKLRNENNSIKNLYFGLLQQTNYLQTSIGNNSKLQIQPIGNIKKQTIQAGVALFIILFSFGLFFNPFSPQTSNELLSTNNVNHYHTGKTLKQVINFDHDMLNDANVNVHEDHLITFEAENDYPVPQINDPFPVYTDIYQSNKQIKRSKISVIDDEDIKDSELSPHIIKADNLFEAEKNATGSVVEFNQERNNSFIYCPKALELQNINSINSLDSDRPIISIILPSTALGIIPEISDLPEQSLIEVTCQVLNLNVFPHYSNDLSAHFPEVSSTAPLLI